MMKARCSPIAFDDDTPGFGSLLQNGAKLRNNIKNMDFTAEGAERAKTRLERGHRDRTS